MCVVWSMCCGARQVTLALFDSKLMLEKEFFKDFFWLGLRACFCVACFVWRAYGGWVVADSSGISLRDLF